jgi:hypothetical protein
MYIYIYIHVNVNVYTYMNIYIYIHMYVYERIMYTVRMLKKKEFIGVFYVDKYALLF